MSKNLVVEDTKPRNELVLDTKPSNQSVGGDFGADRLYTQVLTAGMYLGIPPFTYPEAGTVQSSFSP
jgi:hypothetical protein